MQHLTVAIALQAATGFVGLIGLVGMALATTTLVGIALLSALILLLLAQRHAAILLLATLALASPTGTIVTRAHILVSHCSFSTFPLMPGP